MNSPPKNGKIARLAADAGLRERMGRAAYDHVGKTALWSSKLNRVDAIYADLAGQR